MHIEDPAKREGSGLSKLIKGEMMLNRNEISIPSYEKTWEEILAKIKMLIGNGINNLARLLYLIENTKFEVNNLSLMEKEIVTALNIPIDDQNIPLFKLVACRGKYVLVPKNYVDNTLIATVANRITEEYEFVVELGSGWGRNLFKLYLNNPFDHLNYVACEPTKSGREATRFLGDLESRMRVTTKHFDFHNPDLSFLNGSQNVIFFTNHAIEQCTHFDSKVLDLMIEKTANCTCVHMEPIGWQRNTDVVDQVNTMFKEGKAPVAKISLNDKDFFSNFVFWVANRGYNTNLLSVIEHYSASGIIDVDVLLFDLFGMNPFNPSTLIVWRKKGV